MIDVTKNIRIAFTSALFALTAAVSLSALPFNSKLTVEEQKTLAAGDVLIRNIGSVKNISLESSNPCAQSVLKTVNDLNPAYLAEIIQIRPYKGNEDLLSHLDTALMDVSQYVGIPYFSERTQSYWPLYASAKIISTTKKDNRTDMRANLEMEPFGMIDMAISTTMSSSGYTYISTNMNKLRYYDKFTCVNPEKMKSAIAVFRDGDNWILYGAGAVNAPSIFFLRERVDTSFMNRIKTFCSYFFKKN